MVLRATVTPLASIFGSGFLIIVPVLERLVGPWACVAALGVCLLAFAIGGVVRHNVGVIERDLERRPPHQGTGSTVVRLTRVHPLDRRADQLSNAVIVVAYIISVALYLRIMAQYISEYVAHLVGVEDLVVAERFIASAAVVAIVVLAVTRGLSGLDTLDRYALLTVLTMVVVVGGTLLFQDLSDLAAGTLTLPPVPDSSPIEILLVLGGILITVQGFETVRFLGSQFDTETRILASRFAQVISTVVYVGFVAVATPLMGLGTDAGADDTLLDITLRVTPLLTIPLVITATFSQLAAAVADVEAADGNLRGLSKRMRGNAPFLLSGAVAVALAATVPTYTIVAIASRAFAAYYALQAFLAARSARSTRQAVWFGFLAVVMVAVATLARPVG